MKYTVSKAMQATDKQVDTKKFSGTFLTFYLIYKKNNQM